MSNSDDDRRSRFNADADAAEKHHADPSSSNILADIPADDETEGATNALETPVAPPEMVKKRGDAKE